MREIVSESLPNSDATLHPARRVPVANKTFTPKLVAGYHQTFGLTNGVSTTTCFTTFRDTAC
ncbi:hypothetical protein LIA77_09729 [Sarocladium implicatum]|nr:hypothetical protein LIA77_09729 [Sarocladium implicatum]